MKSGIKTCKLINDEELSAGICDECIHPKMEYTDLENGIQELICSPKKRIIEPEAPEDRLTECEFYSKREG